MEVVSKAREGQREEAVEETFKKRNNQREPPLSGSTAPHSLKSNKKYRYILEVHLANSERAKEQEGASWSAWHCSSS